MPARRYRLLAKECLDRAAHARKLEDRDAWLVIAEDWIRLAAEVDVGSDHRIDHRRDAGSKPVI
jgi:hypothetical protein